MCTFSMVFSKQYWFSRKLRPSQLCHLAPFTRHSTPANNEGCYGWEDASAKELKWLCTRTEWNENTGTKRLRSLSELKPQSSKLDEIFFKRIYNCTIKRILSIRHTFIHRIFFFHTHKSASRYSNHPAAICNGNHLVNFTPHLLKYRYHWILIICLSFHRNF